MIRIGLVGFDTSHVVEFTKRFNHVDVDPDLWVEGAKVVAGCPGTSEVIPQEQVAGYARTVSEKYGVELVDRPEGLLGRVDAVMIEAQEGGRHLALARPFLEAGLPTWIDKPFACTVADAREIAALAQRRGAPVFSSSSLRYAPEVVAARQDAALGAIVGAEAYSAASLHPRNPGLFHYGIHGVEPLYALMGRGCRAVTAVTTAGADVVVGEWPDGRLGVVRGIRAGQRGFGFTAYGERGIRAAAIDFRPVYSALLRQVVGTFQSGRAPLDVAETIEIVAFIVAAQRSAEAGGKRIGLAAAA